MSFNFKSEDWVNRKKELKAKKACPRQVKSIKQITQLLVSKNKFNYNSIEAPPSLKPPKRYCDITGFETKYKDPVTGLFYYDQVVFNYIRSLPKSSIDTYLSIRTQQQIIQ